MKAFYCDHFVVPPEHRFPLRKYTLLREQVPFSVHCINNFPFHKERSGLEALEEGVRRALALANADLPGGR